MFWKELFASIRMNPTIYKLHSLIDPSSTWKLYERDASMWKSKRKRKQWRCLRGIIFHIMRWVWWMMGGDEEVDAWCIMQNWKSTWFICALVPKPNWKMEKMERKAKIQSTTSTAGKEWVHHFAFRFIKMHHSWFISLRFRKATWKVILRSTGHFFVFEFSLCTFGPFPVPDSLDNRCFFVSQVQRGSLMPIIWGIV